MTKTKKIALLLIIAGICLPTATLPFITEFRPVPELCLTSNFFQNMGNMVVVLGGTGSGVGAHGNGAQSGFVAVPYRYLFSLGVIMVCSGLATLVLTADAAAKKR